MAVALVIGPVTSAVGGPEIDHRRVREQRGVDRMIRVVVGQEDVGHVLRSEAIVAERSDDLLSVGHHPGVDHDPGVSVEDQAHRGPDAALVDVAGVEDVERGCHAPQATGPDYADFGDLMRACVRFTLARAVCSQRFVLSRSTIPRYHERL